MPYLFIETFESGLDTRKTRFTAPPGSLRVLKNAHINRGKEIERRKAFADIATLPAGTIGLHGERDQLITFGSTTTPAGMPALVRYQQLTSPNGGDLERIYDTENFAGKVYVVAGFTGGSVHHFYDGALVQDWETLAAQNGSLETIATALGQRLDEDGTVDVVVIGNMVVLTSAVAGTAFSVSVTANMTTTETQAAVAAQPETAATASFEITGGSPGQTFNTVSEVSVDGQDLIGAPVDFVTDIATTAQAVADEINTGVTAYSASAAAGVVTITAPNGLGASANGRVLSVGTAGDVTVANINNFAGGTDPVAAVPEITEITVDSYTATDLYTVTLDGTDYSVRGDSSSMPLAVRTVKQKMYAVTGSLFFFSGFANGAPDPTAWINDATAGEKATGGFDITGGTASAGVNNISSVTVDGVETLNAAVDHTGDNTTTAAAVASSINAGSSGYTASNDGAAVTITAPDVGADENGNVVSVTNNGDVTIANVENMSGGVDAANDPVVTGAGFVDTSTQDGGTEILVGVGVYQDKLAVFSKRTVQLWTVDPDPDLNIIYQVLLNVGSIAANTITEYGDLDVFFLSESGMRSLRARDSSNLASANDVGVSIDGELTDYMADIPRQQVRDARAVVEPIDSRYLLAIGSRVYVFSNFPGSRISAWSTYELEADVNFWAVADGKLHARVGDKVKRYGGFSGSEYDNSETEVVLPFLDASNPAMEKRFKGIDAGVEGTWLAEFATEPDNQDEWETVATLTRSTYGSNQRVGMQAFSTHCALRFSTSEAGPAIIGNASIHFDDVEAD